jgi:hypothetical protein
MEPLYNISGPIEWRFLLSSRANVLLEGTDQAIDRVVTVLSPHFRYPIQKCPRWAPEAMPSAGTLILRDVQALNADEQRVFLRWLEDAGAAVRVISVVSAPLFPLVVAGRFLESLYYRLNVLYITADRSVGGAG